VPTSQTKLTVWNLALDLVNETALQGYTDDNPAARWLNRNYAHAVETTLRAYPWGFAKERFAISADSTAPAFKWSYRYKIPPGALRVLPVMRAGERRGVPLQHEIVGNYIETNEPAPLYVTCIMDKSANPGTWDALFVEIVRCKLAIGMANKFTGKERFLARAQQLLDRAVEQAEMIEAYESTPEPAEEADILRVRGDAYDGRRSWE
jgi:hypothetical protein